MLKNDTRFVLDVLSHRSLHGFCLWCCYSTEQTFRRQATRKSDGHSVKQNLEAFPPIWLAITYLSEDQKKSKVSQTGILIV